MQFAVLIINDITIVRLTMPLHIMFVLEGEKKHESLVRKVDDNGNETRDSIIKSSPLRLFTSPHHEFPRFS